jgi:hypothetical protein
LAQRGPEEEKTRLVVPVVLVPAASLQAEEVVPLAPGVASKAAVVRPAEAQP